MPLTVWSVCLRSWARPSLSAGGIAALFVLGLFLVGCEGEEAPHNYAARVGDAYLTEAELRSMIGNRAGLDTLEARQQVIEQWINRTLLLHEALERDLDNDPEVRTRLEEQRRTVLVTALTNRLYESFDASPSESDVRAYFERHRDQLRLREPYIRVRFLTTATREAAQTVRQELAAADTAVADSVWDALIRRHAQTPDYARTLSDRFYPVSRLRGELPAGQSVLSQLDDTDVAPVLAPDSTFHVLQVVRRLPEGTDPKLAWVAPEIRRRLAVRARKQMYAREVQRLRNQAKAQNALEIR
jgi:hypothetical protein